jgi:glucan 1,3-beta-glucosidase
VIQRWGQGNVYTGNDKEGKFVRGEMPGKGVAGSLLDSEGRVFSRGRPQYKDYSLHQIVSVKDEGAKGDGHTVSACLVS